MKTKKLNKTLSLSKRTIANLNGNEMKDAKGGVWTNSLVWCTDNCTLLESCPETCIDKCDTYSVCPACTDTLLC